MVRWAGLVVVALLALAGTARAANEERPYFDSRASAVAAAVPPGKVLARHAPTASMRHARAALERSLGRDAVNRVDPLTGTTRMLLKRNGALSGPSARTPATIARSYLRAHAAALGLSAADVDALGSPTARMTAHAISVVTFKQSYKGIPAFDNSARVVIDRGGRVIEVLGSPQHDLSVPSVKPTLSAAQAIDVVRKNVDGTAPGDAQNASLTLFGAAAGPVLAWDLLYRKNSLEDYHAVVDANSSKLLLRANMVKHADNDASVYPLYPGAPLGGDPVTVDLTGPGGSWLDAGATALKGNFAHVWSDVKDNDAVDVPLPGTGSGSEEIPKHGADWVYPLTDFFAPVTTRTGTTLACGEPGTGAGTAAGSDCAWDSGTPFSWQTNRAQDGVDAFYLVSHYHDHLANPDTIDFVPPESFEGPDNKVNVHTDDGAAGPNATEGLPDGNHLDNANMDTHPIGQRPTMQMYLFQYDESFPQFEYNGGDDALTVWHEYTHGLSNRLITDADGVGALSSPHAGAMGEAWSDWYALDLANREGWVPDDPDVNGEIDLGLTSDTDDPDGDFGRHLTRTQGLDCPVGSGSSDIHSRCPGGLDTGPGGYTLGDFGKVVGGPEVHADGEIWSETLWDLRSALIDALGDETEGSDLAEFLVTEAMRLSPPEPSMVEARDAILAANDGAGIGAEDIIWKVFAHRGMGYFATATSGSDVHPAEDFHTPPGADTPTGTVSGVVTDSASGLPQKDVTVVLGTLRATTDDHGRYTLNDVVQGSYGKLSFVPATGYDGVDVPGFTVSGGETTTKNVAVKRDWSSSSGGAAISAKSTNAEVNSPFGCGTAGMIDQDSGISWLAPNPNPTDGNTGDPLPTLTQPFATIKLPKAVDIAQIGINPSSGCGDGASASLGQYKLEVSGDGTTFTPFEGAEGIGTFTPADNGTLNLLTPDGENGKGVRYVRLTPMKPQRQSTAASPCPTCSGNTDIGITELEVFGNVPNVAPTGTLSAHPSTVKTGGEVTLTASFTDPDSAITGYDWDFDGNGTTDASTTAATVTHPYTSAGSFAATATAKDFVTPATGSATTTVDVQNPKGPTGSLSVSPTTVKPTQLVRLDASSFKAGDAPIDTYAWDFDGDGTTDRTTTGPVTHTAYASDRTYTARVTVTDEAKVANSASATVVVSTAKRKPAIKINETGKRSRITVAVTCRSRCTVRARLVASKATARKLRLRSRTLARGRRTLATTKRTQITVKLSSRVVRALKKAKRMNITGTMTVKVTDADKHTRTAKRQVTVRRSRHRR